MLVRVDGVAFRQRGGGAGPGERRQIQESSGLSSHLRQHRCQIGAEYLKGVNQLAAHLVQTLGLVFLLGQLPRFVGIHIFVHHIGQRHNIAQGAGVFAVVVVFGNGFAVRLQLCQQGAVGDVLQAA